jgi:hypothetical protein
MMLISILCGCAWHVENDVVVCEDKSMLIDFHEEDGMVHIICLVTLNNKTNEDVTVKINGFSQEDVENGLLVNAHLSGINVENQSDTFLLKAKTYSEFLVDFSGEFAGVAQKTDRLIPDVVEIEIVD